MRVRELVGAVMVASGIVCCWRSYARKSSSAVHERAPLISFGVIADIQYLDADNGHNFARTMERHYRGSLGVLKQACGFWIGKQVDFVMQLGDIVDGQVKVQSALDSP